MGFFREPWMGVSLGRKIVASAWLFGTGMCLLFAVVFWSAPSSDIFQVLAPPLIGFAAVLCAYLVGVSSRSTAHDQEGRGEMGPPGPVSSRKGARGLSRETVVLLVATLVGIAFVSILATGPLPGRLVSPLLFILAGASAMGFARWEPPEAASAGPATRLGRSIPPSTLK